MKVGLQAPMRRVLSALEGKPLLDFPNLCVSVPPRTSSSWWLSSALSSGGEFWIPPCSPWERFFLRSLSNHLARHPTISCCEYRRSWFGGVRCIGEAGVGKSRYRMRECKLEDPPHRTPTTSSQLWGMFWLLVF